MKYFIYARKSSEDDSKQVQSIEDQLEIANKTAKLKGLEVVEAITESKSASSPGRPLFNYMMNRIEAGEAEGILCWKLDRLSRNPIDGGRVIWALQKGIIKEIITNDKSFFPSDSVMLTYVELGVANQSSIDLGKNAKRGMKSKCEKGWLPGVAPVGYINNKYDDKGSKTIHQDPEHFRFVRKMWDLMLTGNYSVKKICKMAKQWGFKMPQRRTRGGGDIGESTLYGILTNSFYYGEFKWDGEWYVGKHTPMITRDEFDHVQKILKSKDKQRPKTKEFAFTGMIRCGECNCMITAQENTKFIQSTKTVRKYTYYCCTHKSKTIRCSQKSTTKEVLEDQIVEFLEKVSIAEVHIEWILKYLHEFNEYEASDRQQVSSSLKKELDNCSKQLENLIRLKIKGEDLLSDDEFKYQRERLMADKRSLLEKLGRLDSRQNNWVESAEKSVNFLRNVINKFKIGDVEEKKTILSTLGTNLVLKDGILSIEAKNEYIPLQKGIEKTKEIISRFKPLKGRLDTAKNDYQNQMYSVWLPRLDSNQ